MINQRIGLIIFFFFARNNELLRLQTLWLSTEQGLFRLLAKYLTYCTLLSGSNRIELCIDSEMKNKIMVWRLEAGKHMNYIRLSLFYLMREENAKSWQNAGRLVRVWVG